MKYLLLAAIPVIGSWVAVIYDQAWWPGMVEKLEDAMAVINFMKPTGRNKFVWPTKVETDTILYPEILCSIDNPPEPVTRRYFSFDITTYNKVQSTMDQL